MLRDAFQRGVQDAFAKFALATQPSLRSVGIDVPKGVPSAVKTPTSRLTGAPTAPTGARTLGQEAAKSAAWAFTPISVRWKRLLARRPDLADKYANNVGIGALQSRSGETGASPGEPADAGRRQQSVIDRTFQQNDDFYATSSMPAPGGNVSP